MAFESHTIVRKVRDGSDGGRFVLLSELAETTLFVFRPTAPEMTIGEVCAELIRRGISEVDAANLVAEAVDDFAGRLAI